MTSRGSIRRRAPTIRQALAADPQNLSVMNNLGMSYALEGNLKQAEATLRQADALPRSKSEPRIRQNLALVVGLQGRFEEASTLAREDLPPEQVEANMAYLQKMLSQPNTWQQISEAARADNRPLRERLHLPACPMCLESRGGGRIHASSANRHAAAPHPHPAVPTLLRPANTTASI